MTIPIRLVSSCITAQHHCCWICGFRDFPIRYLQTQCYSLQRLCFQENVLKNFMRKSHSSAGTKSSLNTNRKNTDQCNDFQRPHFVASSSPAAYQALVRLKHKYNHYPLHMPYLREENLEKGAVCSQYNSTLTNATTAIIHNTQLRTAFLGSRVERKRLRRSARRRVLRSASDTISQNHRTEATLSSENPSLDSNLQFHSSQFADVLVALGGDGFLLSQLHKHFSSNLPVFGMNRGTVGFLMNEYEEDLLFERLSAAVRRTLQPLRMRTVDIHGYESEHIAFNEVSVFRQTRQAAHICVSIDGITRIQQLMCDGILVATPAGSTAYNASAGGIMLPLDSGLLALTPICAFRPRRLRGGVLHGTSRVVFENLNPSKRPISATADFHEIRDVVRVHIERASDISIDLLYDSSLDIDEKVWHEQFQ
eukprot:gene8125-773_t